MELLRPDVYVQRVPSGERPISSVGTSTGAFIGVAPRGTVGKALLCSSWSDFIRNTALGLDTPFMANSDLAYAVYGFFQNGGSRCYVTRVASDTATKAQVQIPSGTGIFAYAIDEGIWANDVLSVQISANPTHITNYDVTVKMNGSVVETFTDCSNDSQSQDHYSIKVNGVSSYIAFELGKNLAVGTGSMDSGTDGVSDIQDADYLGAKGVQSLNGIEVNLVSIPGQTSNTVLNGITDYCSLRGDCFAVLDLPSGQSTEQIGTTRAILTASDYGAPYYPWGKVVDPLSSSGRLRLTPLSGHIVGMYARTDSKRGVHKAPAGDEATLLGVVELERSLAPADLETLNPLSVNCIIAKPNIGIVVWGARTLSSDPLRRYVSDVRFDINIEVSCKKGSSWVVFEPNGEDLWMRFQGSLETFLHDKWVNGQLKGATKKDAYYVKCDAELNPDSSVNQGEIIAEIGYAKKRPAEFVIIRIVQKSDQ